MFIKASKEEVEALLEGLYEASRRMDLSDDNHPIFVLTTKDRTDRNLVERFFLAYMIEKYGVNEYMAKTDYAESESFARFEFAFGFIRFSVMLIDIASIKRDEPHQKDCS